MLGQGECRSFNLATNPEVGTIRAERMAFEGEGAGVLRVNRPHYRPLFASSSRRTALISCNTSSFVTSPFPHQHAAEGLLLVERGPVLNANVFSGRSRHRISASPGNHFMVMQALHPVSGPLRDLSLPLRFGLNHDISAQLKALLDWA